jgi:PleD family two-component response regulator
MPIFNARKKPLILVIDDDPMHRSMAVNTLQKIDFEVSEAEGGEEGLLAAKRLRPDLIVLDVMMAKIDGFTVCSRLRSDPEFMQIPILMVTALDDLESIEKAYDVGATEFITKPINWLLFPYHIRYMHRASKIEEELIRTKELLQLARISA